MPLLKNRTAMPAAGMKRSTRAFGVVMKGSDSGRVLRSGRRLFPEQSVEEKTKRGNVGDDCPKQPLPSKKTAVPEKTDEGERAVREVKRGRDGDKVDRMYGIVYSRKRRRTARSSRLKLYKKKREVTVESGVCSVLSVVVKPCVRRNCRFSSLLVSVLRYMRRVTVTLPELMAFFMSQPIHAVFDSQGVKFLQVYFLILFICISTSYLSICTL